MYAAAKGAKRAHGIDVTLTCCNRMLIQALASCILKDPPPKRAKPKKPQEKNRSTQKTKMARFVFRGGNHKYKRKKEREYSGKPTSFIISKAKQSKLHPSSSKQTSCPCRQSVEMNALHEGNHVAGLPRACEFEEGCTRSRSTEFGRRLLFHG